MLVAALWCCMWGRGPRGSNGTCSALCQFSVTPSATHIQIGPFWCYFPSGWVCVCSRTLLVSPTNSPVSLGVSPSAASTPTDVFNQSFEALFPPRWNSGLCSLLPGPPTAASPASCSFAHPAPQSATSLGPPAAALPQVLSARMPISAPPTGLGECFFFISLVVRLPYSSIFCQFWLFFVFKLLSFFWLCKEAWCVYLHLHLGQKSRKVLNILFSLFSFWYPYDADTVMLHVVTKVS